MELLEFADDRLRSMANLVNKETGSLVRVRDQEMATEYLVLESEGSGSRPSVLRQEVTADRPQEA